MLHRAPLAPALQSAASDKALQGTALLGFLVGLLAAPGTIGGLAAWSQPPLPMQARSGSGSSTGQATALGQVRP